MYWPVIRGCTAFVESLALGYKALGISSEHAYEWDEEESDDANELDADKKSGGTGTLMTISMIVGIVLGIVIFVVLPAALSNLVLGEEHELGCLEHLRWHRARRDLHRLHLAYQLDEGYTAHVQLPRCRAQDHPLLRAW